jgi:SAM-dependent methyltransferase
MTMQYGPIDRCQSCNGDDLESVVFVGYLPPVNALRPIGERIDAEAWFPADLLHCHGCTLVQLGYAVDPAILFPPEYPYRSGTTRILRENFADLHRRLVTRLPLRADDLVVDVGSNDGTLLENFRAAGVRVLGIEPTDAALTARERGIASLQTFFDATAVTRVLAEHGPAKVVVATNVFAHIHGVPALVENIGRLLGPGGLFVSESHYLRDLVETLQYDTVYHEHLRYYSLTSLSRLLGARGFRVVHAERIPTHGGSIRVYAEHGQTLPVDPSVERILAEERAAGLTDGSWAPRFRERMARAKLDLYGLLREVRSRGARIYGVGAPSRASTLLTWVGLDDTILDCVLEVPGSPKIGKYMPGTRIPVLDETWLAEEPPDVALLLSWHIADELAANLTRRGYRGEFIVPLPEPRLISGNTATAEISMSAPSRNRPATMTPVATG